MKTALLIRMGAFGDMIMSLPVAELLKKDNYHVTLLTSKAGEQIVLNNPHIDKIMSYKFDEHWNPIDNKKLPKNEDYDRVVDLSGSVEETLLSVDGVNEAYQWSKEKRHATCNKNYYDSHLEVGGYGHLKGIRPKLYFTSYEHEYARKFRRKHKNKFLVLWSLSGSAFHKAYPYSEIVAQIFMEKHPDVVVCTMGGVLSELLEWESQQTINCVNKWTIRKSMLMTKYADLVIGTETGVLNAAGCYDTPKIILLSHSTEENLTKYWDNVYPLHADVPCYACHQIHYDLDSCPVDKATTSPICMAKLKPETVLKTMEIIYDKWEAKRKRKS